MRGKGNEEQRDRKRRQDSHPQKDQRETKQTGLREREVGQKERKKRLGKTVLPSWVLVSRCREWWSVSHSSSSLLQHAHAAHTHTTINATPSASPSKYHGQQTRPIMNLCSVNHTRLHPPRAVFPVGVCYKNHCLCGTPCPTTLSSQHNIVICIYIIIIYNQQITSVLFNTPYTHMRWGGGREGEREKSPNAQSIHILSVRAKPV